MTLTINQALVMRKALIERRNQLKELVEKDSRNRMYGLGEDRVREEPAFNIQHADKMKSDIDLALFDIDSLIKQANAKAEISLPEGFDFKSLMSHIQGK